MMDLPFVDFGIALLIGALVGIDRERHQASEPDRGIGGLRTFILLAEAGAVCAWLSVQLHFPWIFAVGTASATAVVGLGYLAQTRAHPNSYGLTTEVAALVVFLLGGLTLVGFRELAVALAVMTSAVLAYKHPLHGLVGKISQDDLLATLRLLIATFIVLPVLPDRTFDPWNAVNPHKLWLLVILISALSLVGYVASRWLGPRRGSALTGLFGGLVSSTAVTLSFSRRSIEERAVANQQDALAAGLMLAWSIMFVRVVIAVAVVNQSLVPGILVPMLAMGAICLAAAVYFFLASRRAAPAGSEQSVPLKNPFSLTPAVKFALLFAAVLVIVKLAETYLPRSGFYLVAAVAGLTDVDAIALSMAEYAKTGDGQVAAASIAIATLSNTLAKCGLVVFLADKRLKLRIALATGLILIVGAVAIGLD
jgi:uncharacterized membrane protein (DUF4010 family)